MELANSNNFSSVLGGCGLPPIGSPTKVITGTKRECKKILGKEICVNVPTIKTVPNEEYLARLKKYNDCVSSNVQDLGDKVSDSFKKVTKKLNQLVGKAKDGMRKRIRKAILKRVSGAIRINAHGIATRLFPAIISQDSAIKLRYKASFIPKAKVSYNQALAQWVALGGTQATFNDAIKVGASKRIHRFKKSPYTAASSQSSLGSSMPKKSSFDGGWSNWTGDNYSNVMGPEAEDEIPEYSVPEPSTETLTAEELAALEAQGADEGVDQEEKQKGFMAWIQRILAIFQRNKAEETPYEEGTAEANVYSQDKSYDQNTLPTDTTNVETQKALDALTGSDKIMGLPKTGFYIGLGVVVLVGGFLLYKGLKK